MTRVGSLESRIESVWASDLSAKPRTFYLLPFGGQYLIATNPKGAVEIGMYTSAVTLEQFRSDVFSTLEGMRPG